MNVLSVDTYLQPFLSLIICLQTSADTLIATVGNNTVIAQIA
ncbi:Uncharacterised protein [Segatella copri]|nr:Uncharacterised protein [Segatella copri]